MPTIERITPERAALFKSVRLRALLDAPTAFGSTNERESQLMDEAWIERAAACSGEQGSGYLAMDQQAPCGLIGAYLEEADLRAAPFTPEERRWGIAGQRGSNVGTKPGPARAATDGYERQPGGDSFLRFAMASRAVNRFR